MNEVCVYSYVTYLNITYLILLGSIRLFSRNNHCQKIATSTRTILSNKSHHLHHLHHHPPIPAYTSTPTNTPPYPSPTTTT